MKKTITRSEMKMHIIATVKGVHVCIADKHIKAAKNDGYWLPINVYLIPESSK